MKRGRWWVIGSSETGPPIRRGVLVAAALCTVSMLPAAPLPGQAPPLDVDTAALGDGPHARLHMLLEKTIFQVDVLTLEARLGADAAADLAALLASPGGRETQVVRDSIATIALDARDALFRLDFQRDVGLERFLDGIRENLRRATRAGLVSPDDYGSISASLPGWYDFLEGRGLRSGDRMIQRIRGDTLRTVYLAASGEVLLDQVDVGSERRLAVLGGYFAPGSDFREGLVDSALEAR